VKAGPGIDLDPMGLDWMRTVELLSRNTGIEYRMIHFDDLDVILPGFPGPFDREAGRKSLSNGMVTISRFATRLAYGASQLPRVAWYVGHGVVMQQLSHAVRRRAGQSTRPRAFTGAPVPDRRRLYANMATLFLQDLANVEAGIYPLPTDHDGSLPILLQRSRLFFEDLPNIHRRRENGQYREVLSEGTRGKRPSYYLQNFHFPSTAPTVA
jgi:hypothetical protein